MKAARVVTWNIRTMYENHPSSKRDEKLQDRSAGTEWDKVETFIWRTAAVLRTHRGWSPPYWGCGPDVGTGGTWGTHRLGTVHSRIIKAKFTTKKKDVMLNTIQCYAPTNDAEEEKKDDFYQQLQAALDRRGAKDIVILIGDFNTKIGMDNSGYEDVMGTNGLEQMNEHGERFADLCALNQLVIGGIFPHKRIQKATWISPNYVTENEIDRICISRKFRGSWRDVRVMRSADVSSDHHLFMTTVRLRLKRFKNANSTRTTYNVGLLRNKDTQAAFQISFSNKFQPLQELTEDDETDIETQWEHCMKLWHDTCEEVLGKKKTQRVDLCRHHPQAGNKERGKLCWTTVEQEQLRQRHRKNTQQRTEKYRGASGRIRGTTSMT